jgi:putative transposase
MPQSLAIIYVHLVFSTKDRLPLIADKSLRAELHSYLGGISNRLGYIPMVIGGVEDHVHILARQSKRIALSDWIRDLKANSSSWIKGQGSGLSQFSWQSGYGAFSVGAEGVEATRKYILDQEEHHKHVSFQDELRQILIEHGIEPDEAHLWN